MSKHKNVEMERMIASLKKHLERTDLLGYAAARNTRILNNETMEYFDRREKLIVKYGVPEVDENGNETGRISLPFNSDNFKKYVEEIEEWANVEHEPDIYKIPASEVIGKLSGSDILEIDWMIDD